MTSPTAPAGLQRLPPRRRGWRNTVWAIVGIVGLVGLLVACCLYTAPTLISDWQVRDAVRRVADGHVSDGKCESRIVLHICNATLTVPAPGGPITRRVNYVFSGIHVGDYGAGILADPRRPDLVTTDLGMDRLWNRTITLLVLISLLALSVAITTIAMFRNRRVG